MGSMRTLWNFRSIFLLVLLPVLLLPIPLLLDDEDDKEAACGYCIILMSVYWISEVLPIAVTSFIPLILFPLMGIMTGKDVSASYMKDITWIFLGGITLAVAIEQTNLHKRIALSVLLYVGSKPHSLMFGFMLPTYLLSMWISNTATTAMMIPIVSAVIDELKSDRQRAEQQECMNEEMPLKSVKKKRREKSLVKDECADVELGEMAGENGEGETEGCNNLNRPSDRSKEEKPAAIKGGQSESTRLDKGLILCIPYASTIGGMATVTGSGTNLVLFGQYQTLFPYTDTPLTFSNWMAYHLPISVIYLVVAYVWLMWWFLGLDLKILVAWFKRGNETKTDKRVGQILKNEYEKLGRFSWSEVAVATVLVLTILLWFFRDPGFMPGWSILFKEGYVSDGTVGMTMATLLFILPSKRPAFLNKKPEVGRSIDEDVKPILGWPALQKAFPWNILFLLGGGLALAEGATRSGFSDWLGSQLASLSGMQASTICLVVSIIACLLTECIGNIVIATLFVPIIAELARVTHIHPLYLLLPTVEAASLSLSLRHSPCRYGTKCNSFFLWTCQSC